MNTILVWLALLQTSHGQMLQVDNIANQADCERIVQRFEYSNRSLYNTGRNYASGICTQYNKLVQAPVKVDTPIINVHPAVPVIKNNVIVEQAK